MKTILLATGDRTIDEAIVGFENYEVIGSVYNRSEIKENCKMLNPDILIISEGISGKELIPEIVVDLSKQCPNTRVVFLTGSIDFTKEDRRTYFTIMVFAGVYDIIHEDRITDQKILHVLDNPAKKEDVKYLIEKPKSKGSGDFVFVKDHKDDVIEKDYHDNLFTISSIKPGTGKSFISTNIATMIAEYGVKKHNGQRPRVALIEADLQNLSLGTLLQIEDDKYNLKTVMDKIQSIISSDGKVTNDIEKIEMVNKHIKSSFRPYMYCNNLYALVGSQLTLQELENVNAMHYLYLVETIINDYDVVIVDTNSSLTHVTTFPLLNLSKYCYYILNLDFNNIRNNSRYRSFLEKIQIADKVKYILNENITKKMMDNLYIGSEELLFDTGMIKKDFDLVAEIPLIPKTIFLNRIYSGKPISLENSPQTLEARYEIAKIANEIWPVSNFENLKKEFESKNKETKKFFWKK